ncbi:MAG TPA: MoaD/ThiS family protein [Kofleriaceae bacterium]|jgi:molybdopterin converting factor small subunit|nr:MoaD/ThiS family protein [Kofleriaceae bacterium]
MPSIRVPSALRTFTGGASDIQVTATTVRDALAELDRRHPGIAARLFDDRAVKPFIRIFVGADDIGGLSGLETKLSERDEVAIVPAIAGGRAPAGVSLVQEAPAVPEGYDA